MPVNLVLVAEGEEEIGSPHFQQIVRHPAAAQALSKCLGVFMPTAAQGLDVPPIPIRPDIFRIALHGPIESGDGRMSFFTLP